METKTSQKPSKEFEKFEALTRKLVLVSKKDIKERESQQKETKKKQLRTK